MFFTQLKRLVEHRVVAFTVADIGDDKLRVCVVPEKKDESENGALTTPLIVVGTASELDADLPNAIGSYVESFIPLNEQTRRIRMEREQAEKDDKAKAEEDRKARAAKIGKKSGSAAGTTTNTQQAKPVAPTPAKPVIPKMDDLFSAGSSSSTPASTGEAPKAATVDEADSSATSADADEFQDDEVELDDNIDAEQEG